MFWRACCRAEGLFSKKKVYIAPLHLGCWYRKSGKKYAFGGAQRAKEALKSCIAMDDSIIIHFVEFRWIIITFKCDTHTITIILELCFLLFLFKRWWISFVWFFHQRPSERSVAALVAFVIAKLKSNPLKKRQKQTKNTKKKEKHPTQIAIIKQIIHIHNVRKR